MTERPSVNTVAITFHFFDHSTTADRRPWHSRLG
jgi:hypothetical protein